MNSHYISRFLTKPWEHESRMLSVLDLDAKRLLPPKSSKSLFALDGLFSDAAERWFDRTFESPVSDWQAKALRGEKPQMSWRLYRAMVMAVLWAAPRVIAAERVEERDAVRAALAKPFDDAALDQIVSLFERDHALVSVPTSPAMPLFFPETAIFALLMPNQTAPTKLGYGLFLALAPTLALGFVTQGSADELRDGVKPGTLQNASAGHPAHCRRVVSPPSAIGLGVDALLDAVVSAQRATRTGFAEHERLMLLVNDAHRMAGLPPPHRPR